MLGKDIKIEADLIDGADEEKAHHMAATDQHVYRRYAIRTAARQRVPGLRLTKVSHFDPAGANCRRLPPIQRSPGSKLTTVSDFNPAGPNCRRLPRMQAP